MSGSRIDEIIVAVNTIYDLTRRPAITKSKSISDRNKRSGLLYLYKPIHYGRLPPLVSCLDLVHQTTLLLVRPPPRPAAPANGSGVCTSCQPKPTCNLKSHSTRCICESQLRGYTPGITDPVQMYNNCVGVFGQWLGRLNKKKKLLSGQSIAVAACRYCQHGDSISQKDEHRTVVVSVQCDGQQ
ncbi:hypothetical protein CBL_01964 [Carabus blaptoides fortunei]